MKSFHSVCIASTLFLAGCPSGSAPLQDTQTEFQRKVTCAAAAERTLKLHSVAWATSEETYIQESFYAPRRNSCVAVLVLTTGEVTPLASGSLRDTLEDTYDIVDTLTYQQIHHTSSGIGSDRTKTSDEINKEVSGLKEQ